MVAGDSRDTHLVVPAPGLVEPGPDVQELVHLPRWAEPVGVSLP